MEVSKPCCLECGKPLELAWQLYCDVCYRKLWRSSEHDATKDAVSMNARGFYVVKDKSGRTWELVRGERWVCRGYL
jgi:hypothetical protein